MPKPIKVEMPVSTQPSYLYNLGNGIYLDASFPDDSPASLTLGNLMFTGDAAHIGNLYDALIDARHYGNSIEVAVVK